MSLNPDAKPSTLNYCPLRQAPAPTSQIGSSFVGEQHEARYNRRRTAKVLSVNDTERTGQAYPLASMTAHRLVARVFRSDLASIGSNPL
jgi:hypothetical protein